MNVLGSAVTDTPAPDVQITPGAMPDVSGSPAAPTEPTVTNQVIQQQASNPVAGVSLTQPTSRLQSVLGAVANAVSVGRGGIPTKEDQALFKAWDLAPELSNRRKRRRRPSNSGRSKIR